MLTAAAFWRQLRLVLFLKIRSDRLLSAGWSASVIGWRSGGAEGGVVVFEVEDAGDAGDVDAGGD